MKPQRRPIRPGRGDRPEGAGATLAPDAQLLRLGPGFQQAAETVTCALHAPAVDARRQVAEGEGFVGQAGLVDQKRAVDAAVFSLAPQLEAEGGFAHALGLPAEAKETPAVALVHRRGQSADAVAGADEAVGRGLALQPLGRQGGQAQEIGPFLHVCEHQRAAGRAVGLGEGFDHAGVLGDAAAIALGAGEGLNLKHDLGLGLRRIGAGEGGREQQRQQANGACGGADALIGGGQRFVLARGHGDGAVQHFGGGARARLVERDAEVGAAHGRNRDRGADGEAARAGARRDLGFRAARLDRQGVIDGAVDGVAAQAADAHAAVGRHDHMAAVGQGQADEGVGPGAQDGGLTNDLTGCGRGRDAALMQGYGAAKAGDARLVRIGAQQIHGQGQSASDRQAARVDDAVLALHPTIIQRPVHIGCGQVDKGVAGAHHIVEGLGRACRGGRLRRRRGRRQQNRSRQNTGPVGLHASPHPRTSGVDGGIGPRDALKAVTVAVNGCEAEALLWPQLQLVAHPRDVHVQRAAVEIGLIAPDRFQNIGPRQRPMQVAEQQQSQGVFLGRQGDGLAIARHAACRFVKDDVVVGLYSRRDRLG
uniref:PE-PGRS family protein n=1 Tax=Parastrongyloides trichosuri TaxID=131310 RepID=A0A0N4Z863_PARTI